MGKKLRQIARNADLDQPEKVLEYIGSLNSPNTKNLLATVYQHYCSFHGIRYEKPRYSLVDSATHVPLEENLDYIIKTAKSLKRKVAFGILKDTGIRPIELSRLTLGDMDLEQGILSVRQTKNFKSRLVPVTASTRNALLAYRRLRAQYGHDPSPRAPFFVNQRTRRCAHRTIDGTFRMMTRQLGLKSVHGREPRLHDFRHTWATRCLAELYQTGKDPNAYLPVLATYLGHVNIACTSIYLHPSPDLLTRAGSQFRAYVTQGESANRGGEHERL
jgi:integrase